MADTPIPGAAEPTAAEPAVEPTEPLAPVDGGEPAGEPPAEPTEPPKQEGYWPDDWREKYVETQKDKDGNPLDPEAQKKLAKRLGRYASPQAALDALISAQNKISSGEYKTPLPESASEEEIAAWREENGIPLKPEDYDLSLPDGLVIGEEDKELVDSYLNTVHGENATPAQVKATLAWYYQRQEQAAQEIREADDSFKEESINALREEWGKDYKVNVNAALNHLNTAPESVVSLLMHARLGDGSAMTSHPEVLKWLANTSRQLNPTQTVVPGQGDQAIKSIETEIASLEKQMGEAGWHKDKQAQERYLELTRALEATKALR